MKLFFIRQMQYNITIFVFYKTNTNTFYKYLIIASGAESLNKIQKQLNTLLKDLSPSTINCQ